jgi:hypothetical protein
MADSGKELLLSSLSSFYEKNDEYLQILKTIIDGKHKLSLRMIDWLVTIYAKNNNMVYWICLNDNKIYLNIPPDNNSNNFRKINLYLDYRSQLKSFKKINFDSFRRHDRISYISNKGTSIETTIGQLNFFKWALENKVIDYIEENYETIEKDMNSRNSTSKRKETLVVDNTKTRKKREELSISATKSIKKEEVEIVVEFH